MVFVASLIASLSLGFTPPDGFAHRPKLSAPASDVAGKPVAVYCARTETVWGDFLAANGNSPNAAGVANIQAGVTYMAPSVCSILLRRLYETRKTPKRKRITLFELSLNMFTLVHESAHLRGIRDEIAADCYAMSQIERVARRYFRVLNVGMFMLYARRSMSYATSC